MHYNSPAFLFPAACPAGLPARYRVVVRANSTGTMPNNTTTAGTTDLQAAAGATELLIACNRWPLRHQHSSPRSRFYACFGSLLLLYARTTSPSQAPMACLPAATGRPLSGKIPTAKTWNWRQCPPCRCCLPFPAPSTSLHLSTILLVSRSTVVLCHYPLPLPMQQHADLY